MDKKCIGVDVGGTSVKIGLFEEDGRLLKKWEVKTRKEENGRHILPDVAASIRKVLEEEGISFDQIRGAGMGVPGPVLPDGSVEICVNLGWHNVNPQKELSAMLENILVRSGNDANVAALGEMWQGGGKGYRDIVMITLGTGVGGGVILNQKMVSGRRTMASCDTPSLLREYGDRVTAKNVLDAAKAGDALADQVVEVVCRYLGLALAQASMMMDPEIFVIGGGVSKAGQYLIDRIYGHYDYFTPISKNKAKIGLATLGNDAGIYGAARLILE